jgi:pimeloyl-ACP methyl ester carboxylesterase
MGGSHLLRDMTSEAPRIPLRRLVLVSAGGAPIQGAARQAMMDYDGTVESMRAQVRLAFADPAWADDDDYVTRRREFSLLPGAYEWFASLALRAPGAQPPPPGDPTPYERIDVPTLLVAGGADQLKPPGYADGPAQRIPRARLHVIPAAGHCPQLEAADEWTEVVATFLDEETPA